MKRIFMKNIHLNWNINFTESFKIYETSPWSKIRKQSLTTLNKIKTRDKTETSIYVDGVSAFNVLSFRLKLLAFNVQTMIFGKSCRLKLKLIAVWRRKEHKRIELFNLSLRKMWWSGNWNGFELKLNLSKNKPRQMKMIKQNVYFTRASKAPELFCFLKQILLCWIEIEELFLSFCFAIEIRKRLNFWLRSIVSSNEKYLEYKLKFMKMREMLETQEGGNVGRSRQELEIAWNQKGLK